MRIEDDDRTVTDEKLSAAYSAQCIAHASRGKNSYLAETVCGFSK